MEVKLTYVIVDVQLLAHLLKKGNTLILDKVNQYFPRSPPRRNDIVRISL